MASELRVNTLKDAAGANSVAMEYVANGSAKAWLATTGAGTPSINGSLNVSSITDNGVADLTMTFSSSMSSAGFGGGACPITSVFPAMIQDLGNTTSANRTKIHNDSGGGADGDRRITIDGDLA